MGKSTISMAIFNSYVKLPEDNRLETKGLAAKLRPHGRWVRSYGSCNGWPAHAMDCNGTSVLIRVLDPLVKSDASKTSSILRITLYYFPLMFLLKWMMFHGQTWSWCPPKNCGLAPCKGLTSDKLHDSTISPRYFLQPLSGLIRS